MDTIIALGIIILLLLLILAFVAWQAISLSSWTKSMSEIARQRHGGPNSDLSALVTNREYAAILDVIDDRISTRADDPELYWYKGIALFYCNQLEEAKAVLLQAISMDPSYEKTLRPYVERIEKT